MGMLDQHFTAKWTALGPAWTRANHRRAWQRDHEAGWYVHDSISPIALAPHLVALVRAGATFHHGRLVERPTNSTTESGS